MKKDLLKLYAAKTEDGFFKTSHNTSSGTLVPKALMGTYLGAKNKLKVYGKESEGRVVEFLAIEKEYVAKLLAAEKEVFDSLFGQDSMEKEQLTKEQAIMLDDMKNIVKEGCSIKTVIDTFDGRLRNDSYPFHICEQEFWQIVKVLIDWKWKKKKNE